MASLNTISPEVGDADRQFKFRFFSPMSVLVQNRQKQQDFKLRDFNFPQNLPKKLKKKAAINIKSPKVFSQA